MHITDYEMSFNYARYNRNTEELTDSYERVSAVVTTNGSGAVQNSNITLVLVKNGRLVTCIFPGTNFGNASATSTIDTTSGTAIPARFRPASSLTYGAVGVLSANVNGANTNVHVGITPVGVIRIGNGNIGSNFTNAQNITIYTGSITWFVAP